MNGYLLGIDLGTGSTKAVAISTDGRPVYTTQVYYEGTEGHATIDPSMIWDAFAACVADVLAAMGAPPQAVSFSSAMHSVMALNEFGEPLTPLLTWADDRSAALATELLQSPLGRTLYEQCGTPVHALSPLCKIAWWRQHEPQLHANAARFVGIKEWIWFRLFGVYEIDYSLASATGMWQLAAKNWYAPALAFAGIGASQLSQPVDTIHRRSGLLQTVAHQLGLGEDTAFVIGASDGCLANLGTGALKPGTAAITIGTSGAVRMAVPRPAPAYPAQLFNYYLTTDHWITGGAINNGGAALQWISRLLGNDKVEDAQVDAIRDIAPGAGGLLFLPYLLGERAPLWDSDSAACFIGLRQQHGPTHLLRAVIEGVCFALRSVLAALEGNVGPVQRVHVSGGFSRSDTALQVLADCIGKELVVVQSEDASALGAALLALGLLAPGKAVAGIEGMGERRLLPNSDAHARYAELSAIYESLYPLLRDTMHHLRRLG